MMGVRKLIACMAVVAMATAVSGQTLTPNGAPNGTPGQSVDFGGGIAHANMMIPTENLTTYSMSLMLSPDLIPGENFFVGQTNQGIHHGLRNEGKLHQAHWGSDHSGETTVPTGPADDPNSWVHAFYTFDFATSTAKIFYNGVNDDLGGVSKNDPNQFGPENFLILGARNGGQAGFDGQIDDVAFWDNIVSDGDIASIAGGTLPTAIGNAAQLYWDFEDANTVDNGDGTIDVVSSATGAGIWDVPANHAFTLPKPPPPGEDPIPFVAGEGNWNARFIKIDEGGANGQVNTTTEARQIVAFADGAAFAGADGDPIITEDVSDQRKVIDMQGNGGVTFPHNHPYPNGVNDASLNDFVVQVETIEPFMFPEGTYSIAWGSDDGGEIIATDADGNPVNFSNEWHHGSAQAGNGDLDPNDNILTWEAPRGNNTSCAEITIPAGGLGVHFDAIMYERGGGDSLEIGVSNEPCRGMVNGFFFTLGGDMALSEYGVGLGGGGLACDLDGDGDCDGVDADMVLDGEGSDGMNAWLGLAGHLTGDLNIDGTVNSGDLGLLLNNFGKSGGAAADYTGGDINNDGMADSSDLGLLLNNFNKSAAAAAVPEPNAGILLGLGMLGLLARRRRR